MTSKEPVAQVFHIRLLHSGAAPNSYAFKQKSWDWIYAFKQQQTKGSKKNTRPLYSSSCPDDSYPLLLSSRIHIHLSPHSRCGFKLPLEAANQLSMYSHSTLHVQPLNSPCTGRCIAIRADVKSDALAIQQFQHFLQKMRVHIRFWTKNKCRHWIVYRRTCTPIHIVFCFCLLSVRPCLIQIPRFWFNFSKELKLVEEYTLSAALPSIPSGKFTTRHTLQNRKKINI